MLNVTVAVSTRLMFVTPLGTGIATWNVVFEGVTSRKLIGDASVSSVYFETVSPSPAISIVAGSIVMRLSAKLSGILRMSATSSTVWRLVTGIGNVDRAVAQREKVLRRVDRVAVRVEQRDLAREDFDCVSSSENV